MDGGLFECFDPSEKQYKANFATFWVNLPLDRSNHTYSIEVAGKPGYYWRSFSERYILSSPYNASSSWKQPVGMPPALNSNYD